jgi:hypothetical protein
MSAAAATKVSRRDIIDDPKEKKNQHLHTEILHDGTIIKRYKKKGTLSDGSLIIKSVEKTTPPTNDLNSDSLPTDHAIKKIRTITQQIYPDGISHVTTTIEEVITTNFKASRLINQVEREECTSDLSDGSKLISSKETKVLSGGNYLSTITTTVHVSGVESLKREEVKQPQHKTAIGTHEHVERHPNIGLETFDGDRDHGPIPVECLQDAKDHKVKSDLMAKTGIEAVEGDTNVPIPPHFIFDSREVKLTAKEARYPQDINRDNDLGAQLDSGGTLQPRLLETFSQEPAPLPFGEDAIMQKEKGLTRVGPDTEPSSPGMCNAGLPPRHRANNRCLVVATRVDSSVDEPIYLAVDYDPRNKLSFIQKSRCQVYLAVSLLLLVIIIVLVSVLTSKTGDSNDGGVLDINALIEETILKGDAKFDTMKINDPRLLALDWILNRDEMQHEPSDPNLGQRYILALLAFQFHSLTWTWCGGNYSDAEATCSREMDETDYTEQYNTWLSYTDECKWYGVSCLDGMVKEISLRECRYQRGFSYCSIFDRSNEPQITFIH